MIFYPGSHHQIAFRIGSESREMAEGIGFNVFLGRDRYYPPTSDSARWKEIEALLDEARPGFLRIGYLEGTEVEGDVTPWIDAEGRFDLEHDVWQKIAFFDRWCARHGVGWMIDPWWVPRSMQVKRPSGIESMADASGKENWRGAPASPRQYAEDYIRPLLHHLRDKLKVTNLRWMGLFNEPIWGKLARDPENFFVAEGDDQVEVLSRTYAEVHRILQEDGFSSLQLVGPGHLCAWQFPPLDFMAKNCDPSASLGAWDMHAYFHAPDWMPEPVEDFVTTHALLQHTIRRWVDFARLQGKPFFITEMGTFFFGRPFWGQRDYETAASHSAAIHDAQFLVRGLNEGVDGFLRWAMCVDATVDGRWGLIEWNEGRMTASPNIFPVYKSLMNAIPPKSKILEWKVSAADGLTPHVHGCAVVAPDGSRRVVLVHDRPGRNSDILLEFPDSWRGKTFSRIVVDETRKGVELEDISLPEENACHLTLMIPPYAVYVLKEKF